MKPIREDPIAALATPVGVSALGVIRVSGRGVVELVDRVFRGKRRLAEMGGYRVAYGEIVDTSGDPIDEVVVVVYRAPRSYTGEDMVEISGHGSPYVLQKILERLSEVGIRAADPGEFTLRAFLNGKLDLAQAEAVADLIEAAGESQRRTALHQMRGGFSKAIQALRERLIEAAALMELELDFAEEDVEFVDRTELLELLASIEQHLAELAASYRWGRVMKEGIYVLIAGRPNAGKSTLLNALVGEERAIVSPIAGTTRDVIEDVRVHEGLVYRFFDTAGLRTTADAIERIGIERMLEAAEKAHRILYLIDLSVEDPADWQLPADLARWDDKIMLVGNKADRASASVKEGFRRRFPNMPMITATDPSSVEELMQRLHAEVIAERWEGGAVVVNARHYDAIRRARTALAAVQRQLREGHIPTDLIIPDLREALDHLGTITGDIVTDDILGHIFGRFCIGK